MSAKHICYNCFKEYSSDGACPYCSYDHTDAEKNFPHALKAGSILNGRYTVGRVLGQGGFGITYIAQDYQSHERVAIKEYFPSEFAGRDGSTSTVTVHSVNCQENFDYGKEQFLEEAKTLAAFIGNEHIVRIYSYFEENNTAYFAMEYVEGLALNKYMAEKGGRLTIEEANHLLLPLMESLGKVHAKGIIHRDIAPDNIIITKDGIAKLIDFGAARYSTGEKSKSLDVILKHGFAPKEQYTRRGRQGPYTDVYALAATYYYTITGKVPPDAIERMEEDDLLSLSSLGVKAPEKIETTLFKALEVNASDRYQNMVEFSQDLSDTKDTPTAKSEEIRPSEQNKNDNISIESIVEENVSFAGEPQQKQKQPASKNKKGNIFIIVAIASVVVLYICIYSYFKSPVTDDLDNGESSHVSETETTVSETSNVQPYVSLDQTQTIPEEKTQQSKANNGSFATGNNTFEQEVWFDDDGVKITCINYGLKMGYDSTVQLVFDLLVENNTNKSIWAGIKDDYANGWAVGTAGNFCNNGLAAGKKLKTTETVFLKDCDINTFEDLTKYEYVLWVDYDSEDWGNEQLYFDRILTVFPKYED